MTDPDDTYEWAVDCIFGSGDTLLDAGRYDTAAQAKYRAAQILTKYPLPTGDPSPGDLTDVVVVRRRVSPWEVAA
jgi:hypothetical protein